MAKIRYFKVKTEALKDDEQNVLEILKEVGKIIHKIWEKQVLPSTGRITIYDVGISREEVIQASETDPDILSPYTVVRRGRDGFLYAVPYTQEYKAEIEEIIELLKQIEKTSKDNGFKSYIRGMYRSWEKGDFDNALIEYLRNDNHKIGILMGPIETYADKLMGVKKTFQFNLRVRRDVETDEVKKMVEFTKKFPILKPYLSKASQVGDDKIFLRVDDVLMFSGRQAGTMSASTNLPDDAGLVKKYGTRVVVYKNSLDYKFEELFSPFLSKITADKLILDKKTLKEAVSRLIILHEISEGLIKFEDSKTRLKGNAGALRELNAYLMGVKSSSYHMLKGIINEKEYLEIVVMLLVVGLDKLSRMDSDTSVFEYARGFSVVFNYLEKVGAITISSKKMKIKPNIASKYIDELAGIVLNVFYESNFDQSQKLFDTYGSFDISKRLPLIKR